MHNKLVKAGNRLLKGMNQGCEVVSLLLLFSPVLLSNLAFSNGYSLYGHISVQKINSSLLNWGNIPYTYSKHLQGRAISTLSYSLISTERKREHVSQADHQQISRCGQSGDYPQSTYNHHQVWCQEEISQTKCSQSGKKNGGLEFPL